MLLPEALAHSASHLAPYGASGMLGSHAKTQPRTGCLSCRFGVSHTVSVSLSGESGWLGWVIRIQISESAARTRNGMERMVWPIFWSTT
jgi:hypothetical protein